MRIANRILFALCLSISAQPLWADEPPDKPERVEKTMNNDRFVAGGSVSVNSPVAGDLIAAGGNVGIGADVAGDLVVAGGNLRLSAPVKQGMYAAGGNIFIDGPIQRNLRVFGGSVELGRNAAVMGNVSVGGGEVAIDGSIGGYLQIGGGQVRINGPVGGDVEVAAGRVELGPNARIAGKLRYTGSEEVQSDPAAQVAGGIEHVTPTRRLKGAAHRPGDVGRGMGWVWTLGLLVAAAILVGALPSLYSRVAETVRTRWAISLLIGFIALVCVPVAAAILLISVIGIPLALLAILLYFALLIVGYVSAGIALGQLALRRWRAQSAASTGWQIAAAVLAVVVLGLLGRVPFLGGVVTFAALLLGIGALLLLMRPAQAESPVPGT